MPPTFPVPEEIASISPYRQARFYNTLNQKSTSAKPLQSLSKAQARASETDCNGSKTHNNDTGSCESEGLDESSIIAIVCIVIVLCVVGYWQWRQSWAATATRKRARNHRRERVKSNRQDYGARRHPHRRPTTDLSGQQLQLRERLDERLARYERHEIINAQQQAQELQTSLNRNRLGTPEAAHLRDRERVWEQYRMRSDQDMIAGLENPRSMAHQLPFNAVEDDPDRVIRAQPSVETLPEYAVADPLTSEVRSTVYNSDGQPRRTVNLEGSYNQHPSLESSAEQR
ncbi:MAG: hypothetical protein Q9226_002543 [Calogaya cf. arnoldii]